MYEWAQRITSFRQLFRRNGKRRRHAAVSSTDVWRVVESLEPVCLLSGVSVLANASAVGYPSTINATVDSAQAELSTTASTTAVLDAVFSQYGRSAGTTIIDNVLYVPGTSSAGAPIVSTLNLQDGSVSTIVFQDFGGDKGTSVAGVFQKADGTILFGGFSNPGKKQVYTWWGTDGVPHESGDGGANHSFGFDVSPLGRMIGATAVGDKNIPSYVDVGVDNSHRVLPEKSGFASIASAISADNQYIVAGASDDFFNLEGRVWKLQGATYILYGDSFLSPSGEPAVLGSIQQLGVEWVVSGTYYDQSGAPQGGIWTVDGTWKAATGPGSAYGVAKIGDSLVYGITNGSGADNVLVISPDYQIKSYSMSELGFATGSTLEHGSLFVAPSGDLGVIGTNPTTHVVTVKTFPVIQDTFDCEVDTTGDGVPEFTGSTQGSLSTTWMFDTVGVHQIDVKMTNATGGVFTGSATIDVQPQLIVTVPRFTTDTTPTISWDSVPGVVQTEVWLNNWTTQQGKVVNVFVPDGQTSYTFESPLDLAHYGVWIRHSFVQNGETITGPWSQAVAMTVRTAAKAPAVSLGSENQISWAAVPGATSYQVWINDRTGTRVLYEPAVHGTTLNLPSDFAFGQFTVWVMPQAIHPTDSWRTVQGTWSPPTRFGIYHDAIAVNPLTTLDESPVITWTGAPGGNYDVYVSLKGQSAAVFRQTVTGNSLALPAMARGVYTVWARQLFADGSVSYWGPGATLDIAERPVLSLTGSTLSWTSYVAAANYELWVSTDTTTDRIAVVPTFVSGTSLDLSSLTGLSSGNFRVWVRALSDGSTGLFETSRWGLPKAFAK